MAEPINRLSSVDSLSVSDLLAFFSQSSGEARKASLSTLITFLNTNLSVSSSLTKQSAVPSATGFSITVSTGNTWLSISPTAGFAAGTIVLPAGVNTELVTVSCSQAVTTLTVSVASGVTSTIIGAPTSLAANGFFTLRYDSVTDAWHRIG